MTTTKTKAILSAMDDYKNPESAEQSAYNFEDMRAILTLFWWNKQTSSGCKFSSSQICSWFKEIFEEQIADPKKQSSRFTNLIPLFEKAVRLTWYLKRHYKGLLIQRPAQAHKDQTFTWIAPYIYASEDSKQELDILTLCDAGQCLDEILKV